MHNDHVDSTLATRCIGHLDELTLEYTERLNDIRPYSDGPVSKEELQRDARDSLEMILRRVGGIKLPERLHSTSQDIGRRRAQLAVPLEAMLEAARLDFVIAWGCLIKHALPHEHAALVSGAAAVWQAVEVHIKDMQHGYLDEMARIARVQTIQKDQLVIRLLNSGQQDALVRARCAAALATDGEGYWLVAASAELPENSLHDVLTRFRQANRPCHLLPQYQGSSIFIGSLPAAKTEPPESWLEGVDCGYAVADGLIGVPASAREAIQIAEVKPSTSRGAVSLRGAWMDLVANGLGDLSDRLIDDVLRPITTEPESVRSAIMTTARAYFRTGSVNETANETFYHRNTVLNHLRRLHEMTGLNPSVPNDAALLVLALNGKRD